MADQRRRPRFVRKYFRTPLSNRSKVSIEKKRAKVHARIEGLQNRWSELADLRSGDSRSALVGRSGKGGRGKLVGMGSPLELVRRRISKDLNRAGRDLEKLDRRLKVDQRSSRRRKMLIGGVIAAPLLYAGAFKTRAGRELVGKAIAKTNVLKPVTALLRKAQERVNVNMKRGAQRFGRESVAPRVERAVRGGFAKILGEASPDGRIGAGAIDRGDARFYESARRKMTRSGSAAVRRVGRWMQEGARNHHASPVAGERSYRAYVESIRKGAGRTMTEPGAAGRDSSRLARSGESAVRQLPRGQISAERTRGRIPSRAEFRRRRAEAKAQPVMTPEVELSVGRTVSAKGTFWPRERREPKFGEIVSPGGQYHRRARIKGRLQKPASAKARATPSRERAILDELRKRGPSSTIPKDILQKYRTTPAEIADMQMRAIKRKRGKK